MDIVLDANVIIDLIELECFTSVLNIARFRFWVTQNVIQEVKYPDQRSILEEQLRRGAIGAINIEDIVELEEYARLRTVLGDGEAASLAVASHRGWAFASYEEGRTRREAEHLLGKDRCLKTPRILEAAIREGVITQEKLESALAMAVLAGNSQHTEHLKRLVRETSLLF